MVQRSLMPAAGMMLLLAMSLAAPADANAFKKFYTAESIGPIPLAVDDAPPTLIETTGNPNLDRAIMWEKGYSLIGGSSFTGSYESTKGAVKLAKKIKAGYVVVSQEYRSTRTGVTTYFSPESRTDRFNVPVNSYGTGQQIGRLTGSVTTSWIETTTVPYSIDIYLQKALYYAKLEKRGAGMLFIPLTVSGANKAGIGRGAQVLAVRAGSPAYDAGILAGDVIVSLNGAAVTTFADFNQLIAETGDEAVLVTLYRHRVLRQIAMIVPNEWRTGATGVTAPQNGSPP